jgi:ribosomal protein S18 acetylase RimI-like enzyme
MSAIIPIPKVPISIRVAKIDDFAAIDAIQKQYNKQLGFFPRAQMEGYIGNGWVVVAEKERVSGIGCRVSGGDADAKDPRPETRNPEPEILGYCASRDRYLKRDELGAIFQLCVAPGSQRKFVGMALLKHVFESAPYGCKLYCCWCAQDIEANRFWEAMGFVPLAFRAGSAKKSRLHIFWQKRIREGDVTTPWWFPSQTGGGSIREDRLVLPIPPGKHWSDEMPRILPTNEANPDKAKQLGSASTRREKLTPRRRARYTISPSKLHFAVPKPADAPKEKAKKEPRRKQKNDPRLVAAARELRDRWLERVNENPLGLESQGKYRIERALPAREPATPLLAA